VYGRTKGRRRKAVIIAMENNGRRCATAFPFPRLSIRKGKQKNHSAFRSRPISMERLPASVTPDKRNETASKCRKKKVHDRATFVPGDQMQGGGTRTKSSSGNLKKDSGGHGA